ncbi:MAG: transglutaminase-like putative cysteine protease [Colwellia sp.]|jgi:transglutaminase-like putative cysteine protease
MTMKPNKPASKQTKGFFLTSKNAWLLWCCQLVNLSSLFLELSTWMISIIVLCLGWQALLLHNQFNTTKNYTKVKISATQQMVISPMLLLFIAVSGCIAIALSGRSLGVLVSMLHLLTFAYTLKAFEIKQRKDFYQLLLLGLFLLASALIFNQTLAFSLFIFFILLVNLTVLHQVFSPTKTLLSASKTVSILLLQSTLLAVTLFIVFPRLSPFWQVPSANSAKTGLSDEVSPGDIASLALSSDLAFRVDFKGFPIPRYSTLYWRAMTLESFDGKKWTRVKGNKNQASTQYTSTNAVVEPVTTGNSLLYDVTVEPSYQSWLFGLAVATSDDARVTLVSDYTLQSRNVLSQITHYQVKSYLQSPLDLTLSEHNKKRNLAIVKGSNPRLEKLATQLKNQYVKPIDRAQAILNTFRESNYFYTLQPPQLLNNSLDQFYFDTKAGFCEHYASSFTYLMRAAGIPARVVIGYLGGEYNHVNAEETRQKNEQQGGHLIIYQYDAHAWSEIWLAGIGWKKIDPTAAVDPQRVESGWSNALLTQQFSLNNDFIGLYQFKRIAWLNTIRLQLDALDYQWTRWVLGYSSKQQYDLLKRWFGKHMPWKTATMVAVAFICAMALITLFYRIDFKFFKRKNETAWFVLYQKAVKIIAAKGLTKPVNMTALDFCTLVSTRLPQISAEFSDFTLTFEQLNYRKLSDSARELQLQYLKKQYKRITVKLS